jgi:hypothetical protein
MDPILESLNKIKIKKIQIFISKKHMVPGFADRGLWPKVTLSLDNKEVTFSLRDQYIPKYEGYAINKNNAEDSAFDKLKIIILRLIGKNKNTVFNKFTQSNELTYTIIKLLNKINARVHQSVYKKSVVKARKQSLRHDILGGIKFELSELIHRHKIKPNEFRSYEIAKIWDDLMKDLIIKDVHDK